jgi:general secretion pathway protein K
MPARRTRSRQPRGFALLLVLWSIALLALLGTAITATGEREVRIADALRASAVAEAAADAAVFTAGFDQLDATDRRAPVDGAVREQRGPGVVVRVSLTDEHWRVPLNRAPPVVLAALLAEVGVDQPTAAALAERIVAWRNPPRTGETEAVAAAPYVAAGRHWGPPHQPFRSVDELGLVLGVSPDLLARLKPHLTVFVGALPDASTPDAVVARALARIAANGMHLASFNEAPTLRVTAVATTTNGAHFTRQAVLRASGAAEAPVEVLDWE